MTIYTSYQELLKKFPGFYRPVEESYQPTIKEASKKQTVSPINFPDWLMQLPPLPKETDRQEVDREIRKNIRSHLRRIVPRN